MVMFRTRLRKVWTNRWAGVVLTAVSIIVAASLFYWVPSPGVSVGVMGVVAVVVSLRTEATATEKVAWVLLILAFLAIELGAIKKDRLVSAREQMRRIEEENQRFNNLTQGINSGFKESISTSTGGDSYCYLQEPNPSAAIMITCPGKYPLYDLEVHVIDSTTQKWVWDKTITGMAANTFKGFAENLPFNAADKQDFTVFFGARNGFGVSYCITAK